MERTDLNVSRIVTKTVDDDDDCYWLITHTGDKLPQTITVNYETNLVYDKWENVIGFRDTR